MLHLLIDEDVPQSAVDLLRQRGHDVILVRDHFGRGTDDPVVLKRAELLERIVVTCDRKRFKRHLAERLSVAQQALQRCGVITFSCASVNVPTRLAEFIELIERWHDLYTSGRSGEGKFFVEIGEGVFRIEDK